MASNRDKKGHRRLPRRVVLAALLTTPALGCGGPPSGPDNPYRLPGLVGPWEWASSCGGISGGCAILQTAELTMMWVFTPDVFSQWFRSDSLVLYGSFLVVHGESSVSNQMVYRL